MVGKLLVQRTCTKIYRLVEKNYGRKNLSKKTWLFLGNAWVWGLDWDVLLPSRLHGWERWQQLTRYVYNRTFVFIMKSWCRLFSAIPVPWWRACVRARVRACGSIACDCSHSFAFRMGVHREGIVPKHRHTNLVMYLCILLSLSFAFFGFSLPFSSL